jgi:hypothetical protein
MRRVSSRRVRKKEATGKDWGNLALVEDAASALSFSRVSTSTASFQMEDIQPDRKSADDVSMFKLRILSM